MTLAQAKQGRKQGRRIETVDKQMEEVSGMPESKESKLSTVGEWKVWSQVLGGVRKYIVGRIMDTTQVRHGGNMEYVDMHYTEDMNYCERLASELNRKAVMRKAFERS